LALIGRKLGVPAVSKSPAKASAMRIFARSSCMLDMRKMASRERDPVSVVGGPATASTLASPGRAISTEWTRRHRHRRPRSMPDVFAQVQAAATTTWRSPHHPSDIVRGTDRLRAWSVTSLSRSCTQGGVIADHDVASGGGDAPSYLRRFRSR